MSNKLSLMPNIGIPRSRFWQHFNHSLDMYHGDVVPVDCFEVIPGDEFSYELSSLIRMSTPIVPIMGNIKAYVHAFFIPLRLLWDEAEKFYGDPSNHDKISTVTPVNFNNVLVPYINSNFEIRDNASAGNYVNFVCSVQDYLGKQDLKYLYDNQPSGFDWSGYLNKLHLSQLKERAYLMLWNDHFRPSLMVPPILINKNSNASSYGSASFLGSQSTLGYPFKPLKGFKQYDYFTASTFSPQYATDAVSLPIAQSAPVVTSTTTRDLQNYPGLVFQDKVTGSGAVGQIRSVVGGDAIAYGDGVLPSGNAVIPANLIADLSQAAMVTINQIRYAFQLQKYFERSNYGNRYFEILNAHYGITNPDSRLQRSERLGSHEFYINVSQVVSTADTASGSSGQNLGNTGAVSVTGDKIHLFTKSFSEPGYIMVVITTKYDRSYSSGFLREDLKSNRFEFYSPEFANLGDQETKLIEIQTISSSAVGPINDPSEIFGFQEHWAEYRYRKDLVSGHLRPGQNFDIWTLADNFDDTAATQNPKLLLGYDFLKEDRTSLERLLATGSSGPDYICDFHAKILATREMPLYSIPGLIDHFGAL